MTAPQVLGEMRSNCRTIRGSNFIRLPWHPLPASAKTPPVERCEVRHELALPRWRPKLSPGRTQKPSCGCIPRGLRGFPYPLTIMRQRCCCLDRTELHRNLTEHRLMDEEIAKRVPSTA